jgi:hypothetical protein
MESPNENYQIFSDEIMYRIFASMNYIDLIKFFRKIPYYKLKFCDRYFWQFYLSYRYQIKARYVSSEFIENFLRYHESNIHLFYELHDYTTLPIVDENDHKFWMNYLEDHFHVTDKDTLDIRRILKTNYFELVKLIHSIIIKNLNQNTVIKLDSIDGIFSIYALCYSLGNFHEENISEDKENKHTMKKYVFNMLKYYTENCVENSIQEIHYDEIFTNININDIGTTYESMEMMLRKYDTESKLFDEHRKYYIINDDFSVDKITQEYYYFIIKQDFYKYIMNIIKKETLYICPYGLIKLNLNVSNLTYSYLKNKYIHYNIKGFNLELKEQLKDYFNGNIEYPIKEYKIINGIGKTYIAFSDLFCIVEDLKIKIFEDLNLKSLFEK